MLHTPDRQLGQANPLIHRTGTRGVPGTRQTLARALAEISRRIGAKNIMSTEGAPASASPRRTTKAIAPLCHGRTTKESRRRGPRMPGYSWTLPKTAATLPSGAR